MTGKTHQRLYLKSSELDIELLSSVPCLTPVAVNVSRSIQTFANSRTHRPSAGCLSPFGGSHDENGIVVAIRHHRRWIFVVVAAAVAIITGALTIDRICIYFILSITSINKQQTNKIKIMAASDQIRQMVNFILQEAHEKANEIRVKVSAA
jgi:hypothetical protein